MANFNVHDARSGRSRGRSGFATAHDRAISAYAAAASGTAEAFVKET